jgi:hypothetical protein
MQVILALFCIFTFFFLLLTAWCFVSLSSARDHQAPYVFLFPALILSTLTNTSNIALEVTANIIWIPPVQLEPALEGIASFFMEWAILLLFLSIIAVLRNRESALHKATRGKAGGHNPIFVGVYAILALSLFILGTACMSMITPFHGICFDLGPSPGLVYPYFKNGNVKDYLNEHPDADRMKFVSTYLRLGG